MVAQVGYVPTAEQVAARVARRAAQQEAKAANQAFRGGRTVFDKKLGEYVSINVGEVAAKKAARKAAEEAANAAKEAAKFGGKTVKQGDKFVSVAAETVRAESVAKNAIKLKLTGIIDKLKNFAKSKVGMITLGLGAGVAVLALIDKFIKAHKPKVPQPSQGNI